MFCRAWGLESIPCTAEAMPGVIGPLAPGIFGIPGIPGNPPIPCIIPCVPVPLPLDPNGSETPVPVVAGVPFTAADAASCTLLRLSRSLGHASADGALKI